MRSTRPATLTVPAPSESIACKDCVTGRFTDGICVDSAVLQRFEFGHTHPDLFGQSGLLILVEIGLQPVDVGSGAVVVQQAPVDDVLRH